MGRAKLLPAALFILAPAFIGECRAGDPAGLWLSETGKSRYRVTHCASRICVQLVWIIEGPQITDEMNPDPAKRRRRVMGIDIASIFSPTAPIAGKAISTTSRMERLMTAARK